MIYYMIRHKATSEFMPELKRGRGYSYWNPSVEDTLNVFTHRKLTGTPRLLPSRGVAHRVIVQWNAMPNAKRSVNMSFFGEDNERIDTKPDGRSKEDLEIVEVRIKIKGPNDPYWSDLK